MFDALSQLAIHVVIDERPTRTVGTLGSNLIQLTSSKYDSDGTVGSLLLRIGIGSCCIY